MTPTDDPKYQRAKARVEELKGFYTHLLSYLVVNAALVGLNLFQIFTEPGARWWMTWPLLGWGIGLGAHAFSVFGVRGFLGREWEERKIRELMERDSRE